MPNEKTSIKLKIRRMRPGQIDAVCAILLAAFESPLEAELVDRLHAIGQSDRSFPWWPLVAMRKEDGLPIGFAAVTIMTLNDKDDGMSAYALGPIAVLPQFQRMGVGAALVRQTSRFKPAYPFIVLGDPAYYSRFGFEPASKYGLKGEFGGGDAFMILVKKVNWLPPSGSLLRYHPLFRRSSAITAKVSAGRGNVGGGFR